MRNFNAKWPFELNAHLNVYKAPTENRSTLRDVWRHDQVSEMVKPKERLRNRNTKTTDRAHDKKEKRKINYVLVATNVYTHEWY